MTSASGSMVARHDGDAGAAPARPGNAVGVPAHDLEVIEQARQMADSLGPDEELDITLGVVPAGAQHDQIEHRPIHRGIIPVDNRHLRAGIQQGRLQRCQIRIGRARGTVTRAMCGMRATPA
jgi:hypothetical protein